MVGQRSPGFGVNSLEQEWIFLQLAVCRTIHEPAANPVVWPIFQILFGP
jgi:hypothetical protein